MMPPLPEAYSYPRGDYFFSEHQMTYYGKACAAAEQDRILRIVHEQANAYGKPGECMAIGIRAKVVAKAVSLPEPSNIICNPHPNAPHGFSRNASHSAGRYVCDCEGWIQC